MLTWGNVSPVAGSISTSGEPKTVSPGSWSARRGGKSHAYRRQPSLWIGSQENVASVSTVVLPNCVRSLSRHAPCLLSLRHKRSTTRSLNVDEAVTGSCTTGRRPQRPMSDTSASSATRVVGSR